MGMNPTNKLRWIMRAMLVPVNQPVPRSPYDVSFTWQPNYGYPYAVTVQTPILQQWWEGVNNNGDVEGEWRDVPVEVE